MTENKGITVQKNSLVNQFTEMVVRESVDLAGQVTMNDYEKTLAGNIFRSVEYALVEYNVKNKTNLTWENINLQKMAKDTLYLVKLGINATIPGHVYSIIRRNGKTEGLFDVQLRVGYKGEEYYVTTSSLHPVKRIIKRLVYGDEKLVVYPAGMNNPVEGYELILGEDPFNRGKLRGGFAYIEYEDPALNELIVMSVDDFETRRKLAGNDQFWGKWYDKMCLKTLVHEAAGTIILDPMKIDNFSLAQVAASELEVYDDQPLGNGQEITLPQDYGQPIQQNLPPQQPTIQDPIAPEGFTVNQAAQPVRDKAPAPRQSTPAQPQQQSMYEDDAPDFLRDMGGGNRGKKDPF